MGAPFQRLRQPEVVLFVLTSCAALFDHLVS
jgi:hypothetical protein